MDQNGIKNMKVYHLMDNSEKSTRADCQNASDGKAENEQLYYIYPTLVKPQCEWTNEWTNHAKRSYSNMFINGKYYVVLTK